MFCFTANPLPIKHDLTPEHKTNYLLVSLQVLPHPEKCPNSAWAIIIHEETIGGVRDAKRAMEKGAADVYMSGCGPLVNVSLILSNFDYIFSYVSFFLILVHILPSFIHICIILSTFSLIFST